jgi:hypothetical protein
MYTAQGESSIFLLSWVVDAWIGTVGLAASFISHRHMCHLTSTRLTSVDIIALWAHLTERWGRAETERQYGSGINVLACIEQGRGVH